MSTASIQQNDPDPVHDRLVALAQLASAEELDVLRRAGYVQQDSRAPGQSGYWRLRFRAHGHTRTIYLGTDLSFVERVRRELAALQAASRQAREVARVVRVSKRTLRECKRRLVPILAEVGLHYHGSSLRKRRARSRRPGHPGESSSD